MNNPNSDSPLPVTSCVSDSPDTTYIYDDGEGGDYTIRPIPPERLAQAIAERDRIQACLAARKQQEEESRKKSGNGEAAS